MLFSNVLALIGPRVIGWAIDAVRTAGSRSDLAPYAILLITAELAAAVFLYFQRMTLIVASRRIEYDLRNDLFRHLLRLPFSYYNRQKTGDIMARATNDMEAVRAILGPGIMNAVNTVIVAAVALPIMLTISVPLTLWSLLPLAGLPLITKWLGPLLHERFQAVQEQFSSVSSHAQENLNGIRVIKSYAQEPNVLGEFRSLNKEYIRRNISLVKIYGGFFPLLATVGSIGLLLVLWIGGREVIAGEISVGDLVAYTQYHAILTWPMIALGWVINIYERGTASLARIEEILDSEPEIRDEDVREDLQPISGTISIRGLDFAYDPSGPPVLRGLDLEVPAGATVGITGPTGSGKSTLLNLIPRLFQVPEGTLFIDGVDVREIPLQTLRDAIGMVPQESFLFSDTIQENIAYGVPEAITEDIREAAMVSQIHAEITSFPLQFEEMVGERGVTLSGGQKQRVAISRAVIRTPAILIMDDAFSSVDTHTEEAILSGLRGIMEERTTLLVSHRVSTLRDADFIVVLEDGQIVEKGSHTELLKADGHYARMAAAQALMDELESIE